MSEQAELDAFLARVVYNKGIPTLYKFRACHDENTLGNLTRLLEGELWFSPLGEFNDPFEGRPRSVRAFADATEERAAFRDFAQEVADRDKLSEQERQKLLGQADALSTHYASDIPIGFRESLANDCYVFSMSGSREHPLQWSHYADQHTGVCVHLDARQFPITTAMTVDYTPNYPAVALPWVEKDSVRNYIQCALTKAEWWGYEGEFRIVAMDLLESGREPPWMYGKRGVQCPPTIISGLTLGVRMRDPMRQTVVDWCTANRPDLPIEVASMDDVAYKLNFARL